MNLRDLNLADNETIGLNAPAVLARLTSLTALNLCGVKIKTIRPLCVLKNLETLNVEENQLEDAEILHLSAMSHLTDLNIAGAQHSFSDEIARGLGAMSHLTRLRMNVWAQNLGIQNFLCRKRIPLTVKRALNGKEIQVLKQSFPAINRNDFLFEFGVPLIIERLTTLARTFPDTIELIVELNVDAGSREKRAIKHAFPGIKFPW